MEKSVGVLPLKQGIIYGPVDSRRLGRSLGINLSPIRRKLCSFNCVYCHYGWTERLTMDASAFRKDFPLTGDVVSAVRNALESDEPLDYITFSGDGEPTLHPDFEAIVLEVRKIRDELRSTTPLALLTNSSMLSDPSVRRAMEHLDLRMCKLDAGTQDVFERINSPAPGITLSGIVAALTSSEKVIIQTIFLGGAVDNTAEDHLRSWIRRIAEIKPLMVQIYSTDRPVAKKGIERVGRDALERIAARTSQDTGTRVESYSSDTSTNRAQ